MLRRYTSLGLQNHQLIGPSILLGGSNLSDIIVKGTNVAERHALIEYHPITRSYWIRDLGTLGGTFLNDNLLYGMTELKSSDILRFGKSAEYIFEMPIIQATPERNRRASSFRHTQCADALTDGIALPIVGNKLFPKNGNERFSQIPATKKLCQRSSDSEDATKKIVILSPKSTPKNVRPISTKQQRSLSLGKSNAASMNGGKLPYLKTSSKTGSSGYSSTQDATAFLAQFSGEGKKGKNFVGNQLLQRVVRLQHELQRKDEEIAKLKENAIMPSSTGGRVKETLDEYRVNLAEVKAENEKLRGIIAQDNGPQPDNVLKELNARVIKAEYAKQLQEIVFQTFFTVAVSELEDINKTVSLATIRDYSDIISEVVKLLQDPFSFRLMEISAKCSRSFQKENLTKQQKQELADSYDKFLKQTIYPLSKALDTFLPIIKDVAVEARESAKACNIFSIWSREFGEAIIREGLTWEVMIYKAEELQGRFREAGIPKHWLPPSIVPLFKTIIEQFKRQIPRHHSISMVTETSRSDPAVVGMLSNDEQLRDDAALSILRTELDLKNSELKKTKTKVTELRNLVDQLHTEKEALIMELSEVEDTKLNLDKSAIRARRSTNNAETDASSNTPIIVPRIELQESQDDAEEGGEGNKIGELEKGDTPEKLQELIEEHETEASPPSEVSEEDNTIDEFEKMEEEAAQIMETLSEKSGDADDEISTPRLNDGEKHGIEEEFVDAESVIEDFHDDINVESQHELSVIGKEEDEIQISDENNMPKEEENLLLENENKAEMESEQQNPEIPKFEIGSEKLSETEISEEEAIHDDQTAPLNSEIPLINSSEINAVQNDKNEKTIIEFWHLAKALAALLQLQVPEEEEMGDEHERRKTTLDKILEEMQKLLVQIKDHKK